MTNITIGMVAIGEVVYPLNYLWKGSCRMALSIVVWCSALFIVITGLCDYHSKKPVGIYTNVKAPELEKITDLKAYNRAVGKLGFVYGGAFIIIGLISIFVNVITALIIILINAFLGVIIMIMVYEMIIDKKYVK